MNEQKGFLRSLLRILQQEPEIPVALAENHFLNVLLKRRSVRQFKPDLIPEEVIQAVVEAGRMAPSTVNLQTWSFIGFTSEDWRQSFDRPIPFNAPYAILVLADLSRLNHLREEVGFPDEPLTLYTVSVLNAGLAAMNMTIMAEACGLSSVMLSETGQTGLLDIEMLVEALNCRMALSL